MAATDNFASLQPSSVWSHFATLCEIPRPSLREHLIEWAQARDGNSLDA